MDNHSPKRILATPLDWGLGHATRCIPIIRELKKRKTEIFLASSGNAFILLKEEFPELPVFALSGYNVHYSRWLPFSLSLFFQIPKFLNVIRSEHEQVDRIIAEHKIELIISDNRFGCWSEKIPSVFITHQVNLQMPPLLKWTETLINRINHHWIKKFDYCWIPDEVKKPITGKLSESKSIDTRYIGMLSRFRKNTGINKKYDLLILLSGPEPQRTVLEEELVEQLQGFDGSFFFVRGLPGQASGPGYNDNRSFVNHLPANELNTIVEESELIICRSGYSTVMDLSRLEKKVIFIPTPGQTEQEYLARELDQRNVALCIDQGNFNLKQALELSRPYSGFHQSVENDLLQKALDQLGL